ncbi:MAG TPA: dienelactone hydrolase family protein [Aliidongia sp.]|nr:dienelactone hydrolase family protein [Aliidongia sp.]
MPDDIPDIRGLFPRMDLSRRGFVVTTLATGFALSVKPAKATIVTDTDGLTAGEVKIPVADGEIPAYRAQPAHGTHFPVVIVVEEIFGVHEHIKDLCRRLAKLGYLAIAPELYSRLGDVVSITDIDKVVAIVNRAPDTQTLSDLDATAAWTEKHGGIHGKVAITGFCRGGRTVWMYCEHNPKVKAGVSWYGQLEGKTSDAFPSHPIDGAANLKVPVLGLYAGKDQGITQQSIDDMKAALAKAHNKHCEFIVYPDAEHGFNADYRPSYNEAAATDGWKHMLAWFKQHGVAA